MSARSRVPAHRRGGDEPVRFAARELQRYLHRMTGFPVAVRPAERYRPDIPGVWVGTGAHFRPSPSPAPADAFDDGLTVLAGAGHARVSGVNSRSVVFAAYRWLEALGCRWLRPGPDGERVPAVADPLALQLDVRETPSYRHRGQLPAPPPRRGPPRENT
jgi:hypothetical protein